MLVLVLPPHAAPIGGGLPRPSPGAGHGDGHPGQQGQVPVAIRHHRHPLHHPAALLEQLDVRQVLQVCSSHSSNLHFTHCVWTRVGNSLIGFLSDSLIFCEQKSDSLMKKSESPLSLFCHEQPERIPHGRSFVKSDRSESLTVALLFWAIWVIRSRSLSKEQWELFALWHKKGKNCPYRRKIRFFQIFSSESLVFKSNKSDSLFC